MKQFHVLMNFAFTLGHTWAVTILLGGQICIFGTDWMQDNIREEDVH
jgi:hypothetical protein